MPAANHPSEEDDEAAPVGAALSEAVFLLAFQRVRFVVAAHLAARRLTQQRQREPRQQAARGSHVRQREARKQAARGRHARAGDAVQRVLCLAATTDECCYY